MHKSMISAREENWQSNFQEANPHGRSSDSLCQGGWSWKAKPLEPVTKQPLFWAVSAEQEASHAKGEWRGWQIRKLSIEPSAVGLTTTSERRERSLLWEPQLLFNFILFLILIPHHGNHLVISRTVLIMLLNILWYIMILLQSLPQLYCRRHRTKWLRS